MYKANFVGFERVSNELQEVEKRLAKSYNGVDSVEKEIETVTNDIKSVEQEIRDGHGRSKKPDLKDRRADLQKRLNYLQQKGTRLRDKILPYTARRLS